MDVTGRAGASARARAEKERRSARPLAVRMRQQGERSVTRQFESSRSHGVSVAAVRRGVGDKVVHNERGRQERT